MGRQYHNVWLRVRRTVTTMSRNRHQLTDVSRCSAADVPQPAEHHRRQRTHDVAERHEASRTEPDKHLRMRKTWPPSHVTNADKFVTSTTTTSSRSRADITSVSLRLSESSRWSFLYSVPYVCQFVSLGLSLFSRCFSLFLCTGSAPTWWINISMKVWWNQSINQ